MKFGSSVAVLISLILLSSPLAAQGLGGDEAAVESGRRDFFMGLLKEGRRLSEQGYYYEACVAFNGILERGEAVESYYQEAEYGMAVNLRNLGLVYSSYVYFARVIDSGETHPYYAKALPWMLNLAREVPGFRGVVEYLSFYKPSFYPEKDRAELAFIVGYYHYTMDDHESAIDVLNLIGPEGGDYYIKAQYVKGVIQARRNKAKESLEAFKNILRFERDAGHSTQAMKELHSKAIMAIARIFYSTADFDTALRYYEEIERYSENWLTALFEKSWTYFRLANYERAMGNLHTLNSPYFKEQYFPESRVLQAVILYTNCRYDDAILVVDQFVKEYDGLRKELKAQLEQNEDPADFYYWLASLSSKGKGFSKKLKRIFNLALADRKLHRRFSFILSLQREEGLLENMRQTSVQKDLAERLLGELVTYRELAIGETGELARTRLDTKRKELQRLVSQAMKVKFEALNAVKEMIEGKRDASRAAGESKGFSIKRDDEHLAWPFEGEYWKDELDSYLFRVDNLCPDQEEKQKK